MKKMKKMISYFKKKNWKQKHLIKIKNIYSHKIIMKMMKKKTQRKYKSKEKNKLNNSKKKIDYE